MKRKLFFWLEQLKITPAERKAVTFLMVLLLILSIASLIIEPVVPYDDAYYAEVDEVFRRQAALVQQQEEELMKRYYPEADQALPISRQDTSPPETSVSKTVIEKVNVNTADAESLRTLPGIGPSYAQRIIDWRTQFGPFKNVGDLLKVKGIGKKRLDKLRPFIKLTEPTEKEPKPDVEPDTLG